MESDRPVVEAEALHVSYGKSPILWDLNFQIPAGVRVALVGPNGAGKSTLLKVALGLLRPMAGRISLFGAPADKVRKKVAYVPQRETVDWDFPITAEEVVLMGRYGRLPLFGRPRQADKEAAERALALVGMTPFAKRQIGELSGGQQQRLFIARALLQEADLLLLDEPFAGVDLATERVIVELLEKMKGEGKTILVVHHDLPTVNDYFDWALLLNLRLIACGPLQEVYTPENLQRTFGKGSSASLFNEAASLCVKTARGIR